MTGVSDAVDFHYASFFVFGRSLFIYGAEVSRDDTSLPISKATGEILESASRVYDCSQEHRGEEYQYSAKTSNIRLLCTERCKPYPGHPNGLRNLSEFRHFRRTIVSSVDTLHSGHGVFFAEW